MEHRPYDFNEKIDAPSWRVDGLIPYKSLAFFISKAGVGKSFLAEYLAVCLVYGHSFLGKEVMPCNVLLIDQESSQDILKRRLQAFGRYMESKGFKRKYNLYLELKGCYLSDGTLIKKIKEYMNVRVIIIDSLHFICGKLDANKTSDMSVLSRLKNVALARGKNLIINHHISEHSGLTVEQIMTTNDTNRLTMGNSVINQIADVLFYLCKTSKSDLVNLYVRPIAKRVSIKVLPFVARLVESEDQKRRHFVMNGFYEERQPMFGIDRDILTLFKEKQKSGVYLPQMYQIVYDMGQVYTKAAMRGSVNRLVKAGKLILHRKHRRLFVYGLPIER